MVVLENFVCVAWDEFTGGPLEVIRPSSDQSEKDLFSIHTRTAVWVRAGYQHLANLRQEQRPTLRDMAPEPPAQAGTLEAVDSTDQERRAADKSQAGYQCLANPEQEQASTLDDSAPPSPAQAGMLDAVDNTAMDRRAMVDAYIAEVLQKTEKVLTRADIWRAASYRSRSEFERWERNDSKRPNQGAHRRFTKILADKPHLKKN